MAAPARKRCRHHNRKLRRCRTRRCRRRVRAVLAARGCAAPAVVAGPTVPVAVAAPARKRCRHHNRKLRRCRTRRCRRRVRAVLAARGCRVVRRRRVITNPRRRRISCKALRRRHRRCANRRCRRRAVKALRRRRCKLGAAKVSRSCRHSLLRLKRRLHNAVRASSKCGGSSKCTRRSIKRVAALRHRVSRARRQCLKTGVPMRIGRPKKDMICKHANRFVKRMMARRAVLLARIPQCVDEDTHCVQRVMKKVLRVNHYIGRRASRCNIKLGRRVRGSLNHIVLKPVYSSSWRHAITCDGMRAKFKKWIRYQNARRVALHTESTECSPLDTSCLRFSFAQILHIQRRIANARTRMAEKLRVCDECAPLKLAFRRWLRRQRARRARIHRSIAKCQPSDIGCHHRRVERIARIQERIRARRAHVLRMHAHCNARGGTHGDFHATETTSSFFRYATAWPSSVPSWMPTPVTGTPLYTTPAPPGLTLPPSFGVARSASASVTTVSMLIVALLALLAIF